MSDVIEQSCAKRAHMTGIARAFQLSRLYLLRTVDSDGNPTCEIARPMITYFVERLRLRPDVDEVATARSIARPASVRGMAV